MPLSLSRGWVLPGSQGLGDPPWHQRWGQPWWEPGRGRWSRGEGDGAEEGMMEQERGRWSRRGGNGGEEGAVE